MAGDCVKHDNEWSCAYLNECCVFVCEVCKKETDFIEMYRNKNRQLTCGECYHVEEEAS
jgi:hypothetical protein